jgi:hypothetical protein
VVLSALGVCAAGRVFKAVARLPSLTDLSVRPSKSTALSDGAVSLVGRLSALTRLALPETPRLSDRGTEALTSLAR